MKKIAVILLLCIVAAAALLEIKLAVQQHKRLEREMSAQVPHAG